MKGGGACLLSYFDIIIIKELDMAGIMPYVSFSWLVWITGGLSLHVFYYWKNLLPLFMRNVYEYGKLRGGRKTTPGSSWNMNWLNPSLPKRWFTHFYVWGVLWNYCILLYFTSQCVFSRPIPLLGPAMETVLGDYVSTRSSVLSQCHFEVWLVLILVCVQVTRRLYECLFVSVFSDSKMSILHYTLGIYFYSCVGLTALLHLDSAQCLSQPTSRISSLIRGHLHWYHPAAALLFLWASKHQYTCHVILANLRHMKSNSTSTAYGLPRGDWFEYVSSPHFFAETLIYLSLYLCQAFTNPLAPVGLVLLCTFCTLSGSARQVHQWYREKFDDYPTNWRIIIPFVY